MTHPTNLFAASVVALTLGAMAPSPAHAQSFSTSSNFTVNCGPGRSAVIRQLDGATHVDCVGATTTGAARASRATQRKYVDARQRSWQKGALMIGGSAGTGAGIGALVGGKKGALVGAALGGGTASIYESAKRR